MKEELWLDTFLVTVILREIENMTVIGNDVWYDRESLRVGDVWRQKIEREIKSRENFVLLLSKNSWTSPYVQAEIFLALSLANQDSERQFYSIRLDDVDTSDSSLGSVLEEIQHLDAVELTWDIVARQISVTHERRKIHPSVYENLTKIYASDSNTTAISNGIKLLTHHSRSLPLVTQELLKSVTR